jgi:phage terminase small subunit
VSKDGLTTKQRLFVESYLSNGFNATEAARAAGYKGNDVTLAAVGYENLRKPQIAAVVSERINEAAMSANEVLARLSKHARGSLFDLLDEDGELNLKDARARGVDDLLKKVKRTTFDTKDKDGNVTSTRTTHEYEIHDAQAALVHLGKYHKLFIDRHEHTGNLNIDVSKLSDDELAALAEGAPSAPASRRSRA